MPEAERPATRLGSEAAPAQAAPADDAPQAAPVSLLTRDLAGARLFDRRRWILTPLLVTALALGGSGPVGWIAGSALLALGISMRLWACRHLGGAARVKSRKALKRRLLVTGGPFAHVRNPIYLGNTLALAGGCLLAGPPWLALPAFALVLFLYGRIVRWEETVLAELYPDEFADYRGHVPRWVLTPVRWPHAEPHEPYPWSKVLARERGLLVSVAVFTTLTALRLLLGD